MIVYNSFPRVCPSPSPLPFLLPHLQSLSVFVIEANMFLAKSSDESVSVMEAQRFLRATRFNTSKAIDIFKNYHVGNYCYEQAMTSFDGHLGASFVYLSV